MSLEATASAKVAVKVQCEKCHHIYQYDETILASRRNITESRSADELADECAKELSGKLKVCPEGKHLGFKKCPKCSHVQSWMLQAQKENREGNQLALSVILSLISCVVLYNLKLGLERMWGWLWLVAFAFLSLVFYRLMGSISAVIRGHKDSHQVQRCLSVPLEVGMIEDPAVSVVRKTVG